MKSFFENIKNNRCVHYFLIFLAATIAAIPLIKLRIYGTDDGFIHILRIMGVEDILKSGTFPPFINQVYCNGFGYAINVFYPPIVTYGPLLFRLIFSSYSNCLKMYTYITIIISGFTMYQFVKELSDRREVALLSAIIYIFIPYRLETIYNRFAIGEFSAYMFIPLVFLGLHNLLYGDKRKHYYITIGAVGLILTHTLTTEYTAIFAIVYLLLNAYKLKNKEVIKKIIINTLFILLISAFFLVPLLEYKLHTEYTIFSAEAMQYRGEDVAQTTISLKQLIKDTEPDGVSFALGIPFIVLILLGIITFRKMTNPDKSNCIVFLVIAMISLFMTTRFFPWYIMPNCISTMQFAWRMLTFFEFAMAVFCGYNIFTLIEMITNSKKNWSRGLLLILSITVVVITMSKIDYNYKYEESKQLSDIEYEAWVQSKDSLSPYSINREYLPYSTRENLQTYALQRENRAYVISGDVDILEQSKNNLTFSLTAKKASNGAIIELPFFNYPGYTVLIENNDTKQKIDYHESECGFIEITIPEQMTNVKIDVKYTGTLIEKLSYFISITSIIIFVVYLLYIKRKDQLNDTKA